MTVEEVRGNLDLTDNGAIRNSIRNCLTVFQNDPYLQGAIRYNILTERIDIVKALWWERPTATLNDTDFNYLMLYLEDKYGLTSEKKIEKAISIVADCNKYHPIRDYLNSLKWDGTERIRYALTRYLGAEDSEYTYECLRLFMLGAIRRVFKPGCKFEVMLCLVGGQGAGKSTFFRLLAVRDEWFSDDLKRIDDDNVYRKMQGHWIIEMSEMIATANAKSIEDIKSFISRAKETYKVPYETHPADRLRQCVFGGSSNTLDFLPLDRSGNRRFLPIMVHAENAKVHILEDEAASRAFIDLMWAEAMFFYHNFPVRLTLSKEMNKELKVLQRQFMPEDTKAGLIQSFLDNYNGTQVCSKLIYTEALNHPFVLVYELIQMILEKNNMHEFDTFNIFKWIFKTFVATYLLTNCFTIVMAVFDVAQNVVSQSAGVINGNLDVQAALSDLETQLEAMGMWELIGLWLETNIINLCMWVLSIVIFVIVYGRMIEIYLTVSLAPIPFSTMANREWGQMGTGYLRSLFALGFQGFLILICVAIYAVLVQSIPSSGDVHGAIWGTAGYTVLLAFALFKTGSLSKSIFNAR